MLKFSVYDTLINEPVKAIQLAYKNNRTWARNLVCDHNLRFILTESGLLSIMDGFKNVAIVVPKERYMAVPDLDDSEKGEK